MNTGAIIPGLLIAFVTLADAPPSSVRTARSGTGQFIVRGPGASQFSSRALNASNLLELDPDLLAITSEHIKQVLLQELSMPDFWRGRIYLEIKPSLGTNREPMVMAKRYTDGWQYQVELSPWMEKTKLVRGLVQVLLLEISNRNAGPRSAEVPLWMSEGLSQHLIHSSELDLVLPQPQWNFNRVNIGWQARQGLRRDPLKDARERLQSHAAPTFARLGAEMSDSIPEETWNTFQASAQLFVSQLLQLPGGRAMLVEMLRELPFYLNWQSAFQNAYRSQFPRFLDVEKWWAVVLVHFTGQDPSQAWSVPLTLEKLEDTLHPHALVSTNRQDMPRRTRLSAQQIVSDWDYLRQRIVLKEVAIQLFVARSKTPPELGSLVDDYRSVIEGYLNKRDQSGAVRSLPGLPPLRADFLVRDAVKALNELDVKRDSLRTAPTPAASALARPAK